MEQEHLQPHEIDLLVDDESGSPTPAHLVHLEQCGECRALLESARMAVWHLEHLPHHEPSPRFADSVMSRVAVFEPLHVTIADRIARLTPEGSGARILAAAMVTASSLVLTALGIWMATRIDDAAAVANFAAHSLRMELGGMVHGAISAVLGEPAANALGTGGSAGIWTVVGLLASSALVSTLGLQLAASAARRGRS